MNTSPAKLLEFRDADTEPFSMSTATANSPLQKRSSSASADTSPASFRTPTFDGYVNAIASRRAGRVNARGVSKAEYESLLGERQSLLDAKLTAGLSRKEENRLTYIRWSLDRIEDAWYGEELDVLEDAVLQYEQFLRDVKHLDRQLKSALP